VTYFAARWETHGMVWLWQIVLQKSFCTVDHKFFEL